MPARNRLSLNEFINLGLPRHCSYPVSWQCVPGNLTCKCLDHLIYSFKLSSGYYTYQDQPGIFRVEKGDSAHQDTALVVENLDSLLVCTSCHWFNVHGCPCPHTLSACKSYRPSKAYLPFITRNLRVGEGVNMQEMFSRIHVESDLLGVWCKGDILGIQETVAAESSSVNETTEVHDDAD